MPELPEVETIRRDLSAKVLRKKIIKVEVSKDKIVRGSTAKFKDDLIGRSFAQVNRRGKLLIFDIAKTNTYLLVHLKMTGQLIYQDKTVRVAGGHPWPAPDVRLPDKHTHITITFSDKSKLYFNDLRQFGFMKIVEEKQLDIIVARFGIEPLTSDFTAENFGKVFRGRKAPLKAVLLNQNLIAGLGNIYADEICFAAGVRPGRRVDRLTKKEKEALYKSTEKIIKQAIKYRGTTFRDYVDSRGRTGNFVDKLKVYGRGGELCLKCHKFNIKKIKTAGRGTHYCPGCQK